MRMAFLVLIGFIIVGTGMLSYLGVVSPVLMVILKVVASASLIAALFIKSHKTT